MTQLPTLEYSWRGEPSDNCERLRALLFEAATSIGRLTAVLENRTPQSCAAIALAAEGREVARRLDAMSVELLICP